MIAGIDEQRLMAKVARLYYRHKLVPPEIAAQLDISQSSVSRLLKRARQAQIVRNRVTAPMGTYPELEEALERNYGLKEAIAADGGEGDDERVLREIGAAAAFYLETTLKQREAIGISSWSAKAGTGYPSSIKTLGTSATQLLRATPRRHCASL